VTEAKYQSTRASRFYPGRISEERKRKVADFELTIDDLTTDDLMWGVGRNLTVAIYQLVDVVRQRWGEQAAIEVANEFVYKRAKAGFKKFLQARGRTEGSPELMSEFQDYAHSLQGPSVSTAYTWYDDEKCIVKRTGCAYHTERPEGMESLCRHMGDSFVKGYMEADPALKGSEKLKCMAFGNSYCERIFYYKK
jgi:hypothetical protein